MKYGAKKDVSVSQKICTRTRKTYAMIIEFNGESCCLIRLFTAIMRIATGANNENKK